jgi:hypothetical protein
MMLWKMRKARKTKEKMRYDAHMFIFVHLCIGCLRLLPSLVLLSMEGLV